MREIAQFWLKMTAFHSEFMQPRIKLCYMMNYSAFP